MKYLIDTDWVIDALGGVGSAVEMLDNISDDGVAISMITLGELYDGVLGSSHPSRHMQDIRTLLSGIVILNLSDEIMNQFARIRFDPRRTG